MAKEHIEMSGEIINMHQGLFSVRLENNHEIKVKLGGKLRKDKIKITIGDKVIVSMSPYDANNGFISRRL